MLSGPGLFLIVSWIAAGALGLAFGMLRAWRFALLGIVVPLAMVIASRFASNDTLQGSEDMSWRILLVAVAAVTAVLFFACFAVGAGLRLLSDAIRHRKPGAPGPHLGEPRV
jgi:hypothetical protein